MVVSVFSMGERERERDREGDKCIDDGAICATKCWSTINWSATWAAYTALIGRTVSEWAQTFDLQLNSIRVNNPCNNNGHMVINYCDAPIGETQLARLVPRQKGFIPHSTRQVAINQRIERALVVSKCKTCTFTSWLVNGSDVMQSTHSNCSDGHSLAVLWGGGEQIDGSIGH